MFSKVAGKFPKKIRASYENSNTFYKIFMLMPRLPNGRSFTLMKSFHKYIYRNGYLLGCWL